MKISDLALLIKWYGPNATLASVLQSANEGPTAKGPGKIWKAGGGRFVYSHCYECAGSGEVLKHHFPSPEPIDPDAMIPCPECTPNVKV